jgi:hypothetical protein
VEIGSQAVAGLAAGATTSRTFAWNTTGRSLGTHTLGANHDFADQNTANCPGLNLCGRTVLYVGVLNKMVPHYRQMVESSGGRFIPTQGRC